MASKQARYFLFGFMIFSPPLAQHNGKGGVFYA